MAIIATYKDGSLTLPNAYIKISRIWLSKEEGFNAWVDVRVKKEDSTPLTKFSINAPYQENVNPFTSLYEMVLKSSFLSDAKSDVGESSTEVSDVPKAKSKKK